MDAFNMPNLPAFIKVKFGKGALDIFPGKELLLCLHNIPKGIGFIPLDRFFPRYIPHGFPKGIIQIIDIGNTAEVIILRKRLLFFLVPGGFPPLVPCLPAFNTGHISSKNNIQKTLYGIHHISNILHGLRSMPHNVTGNETV
jgi:hypothetical protein